MHENEAKKLKVGSRVEFKGGADDDCAGTVIETGYCAVKIRWDDGAIGVIDFRDMQDVFHA